MIQKEQLMIGDWVYRPDCNDMVQETRADGIIGLDNLRGLIRYNELEPIPLTAELLEKNGFTRHGSSYVLMGDNFSLLNPSSPDDYKDNYWLTVSMARHRIEHVHQLQNALRICGITKTIEL